MKLFYSPNSPYARKCRVVVLEKGLGDRVAFVKADPWGNAAELLAANPLGTVPALLTNAGMSLGDSSVICEYLDSLAPNPRLFPTTSADRIKALGLAALADGMIDAAVACVIETLRRPEDKRWPEWIARKEAAIRRTLGLLAPYATGNTPLSIGTVGLGVALSYLSFRLPHIDWEAEHPPLAAWHDAFSQRPSMKETMPG